MPGIEFDREDRRRLIAALTVALPTQQDINAFLDGAELVSDDRPQGSAGYIWRVVLHQLEREKPVHGLPRLLSACRRRSPQDPDFQDLVERYLPGSAPTIETPEPREQYVVLAMATEWSPARGGLSSYNQRLCAALAADPRVTRVFCQVPPGTSDNDRVAARKQEVELVDAGDSGGLSPAGTLHPEPRLPSGIVPDLVIGHGRITGQPALQQAAQWRGSRRIHVIHMAPDLIDWEKPGPRLDVTESRTKSEHDLGEAATLVGVVGRSTYKRFRRDLPSTTAVIQLDPGFRDLEQQAHPRSSFPKVLFFGRLKDEKLKGVDIAAQGMALATQRARRVSQHIDKVELLVRGTTDPESTELRDSILDQAERTVAGVKRDLAVTPRLYTTDPARLDRDLRTASLVLMPSRAEAFGLVGVEAIERGIPVLVSEESGLAEYLRATLESAVAAQLVVSPSPGKDVAEEWGSRIWSVLNDLEASFQRAEQVRKQVVEDRPWSKVAAELLDGLPRSSSRSPSPRPS